MAITLSNLNLFLDVILKLVLLGVLVMVVLILREVRDLVESAERSAESIENTSRKLGKILTVSRYIPFTGRKHE